jgi:hypothetical protein
MVFADRKNRICPKSRREPTRRLTDNQWWVALNLDSPPSLAERALSASGEERVGSNIGKGQMKVADYVLVPDIANKNRNSGGSNIGGIVGGFLPHGVGAVVGDVSLNSKTADVTATARDPAVAELLRRAASCY